jgi:hypothetical protein
MNNVQNCESNVDMPLSQTYRLCVTNMIPFNRKLVEKVFFIILFEMLIFIWCVGIKVFLHSTPRLFSGINNKFLKENSVAV